MLCLASATSLGYRANSLRPCGGVPGAGESPLSTRPIFSAKSTRKSAANSSRSCGTGTASIVVAGAVLVVAGVGGLARLRVVGGQEGRRSRRAFEAAITLSRRRQACRGRGGVRQDRRRRHVRLSPARALPRSGRAGPAAIPRPRSRPTRRSPPTALSARCCRTWPRCAPARCSIDAGTYRRGAAAARAADRPDRTFRHTARELLALSAWRAGDGAATKRWFDMMTTDRADAVRNPHARRDADGARSPSESKS